MTAEITRRLSDAMAPVLRTAKELWVAVGLINLEGLDFLLDRTPRGCKWRFLVGVDLPTHPKALAKLYELQLKSRLEVRLYTGADFYHPKVYIVRQQNAVCAFVGSANCTTPGLSKNIEVSVRTDSRPVCTRLMSWFDSTFEEAKDIDRSWLNKYRSDFRKRQQRHRDDEKAARKQKAVLSHQADVLMKQRESFVKAIRDYRRDPGYADIRNARRKAVSELRHSLDYPHFKEKEIDIDRFFSIWDLGHIIALPKPTIKKEIAKFSRLCKALREEGTPVAQRYDRALTGDLKIQGVSEGLISKLLTIHDPKKYFVKNARSDAALKKYGIELPRGLSKGTKYVITGRFLADLCKETNVDNLATLDHYLYLEAGGGA